MSRRSRAGFHLILRVCVLVLLVTPASLFSAVALRGTFPGENIGDQFGISLCNAGDVDGNAYPDLLVGATLEDTGGDASGKCYLYFGSAFGDTIADLVFTGGAGERLGSGVAGNGDLNGDGFSDFAVGAIGASRDGPFSGKVYVFFGGRPPDAQPDLILFGPGADARFGESVTLRGDISGDGFADLVVGAPRADSTGMVSVYFGGAAMDTIPDLVIRGEGVGDRFGGSVESGGDLNNDGVVDLLVGAPRNSDAGVWAGKVYLYQGGVALDSVADLTVTGEAAGDAFGSDLRICSDFDGDGSTDFFVGAPFFNAPFRLDAGKVYFFRGGPVLDALWEGEFIGEAADDHFGLSVSCFDGDQDGLSDLIVGAPGHSATGTQNGKVYMFQGEIPLNTVADFTAAGDASFDSFGASVAGMGRFNFYPGGTEQFATGGWNIAGTGAAKLYGEPVTATGVRPHVSPAIGVHAYPNPFSSRLHVSAELPAPGPLEITVYDVAGRRVAELFRGRGGPGAISFLWPPAGSSRVVPAGVYFLRLRHRGVTTTRKIILTR